MKKVMVTCLCLAFICVMYKTASADSISKPHTFSDGTPAYANPVNENFDTVYGQVNKIGAEISIDANNDRVGIGTASPVEKLEVMGNVKATQFVGDGSGRTNLPGGGGTGDITAVTAGSVLTGGRASGDVTLNLLDTSNLSCAEGSSIREIKADGTVTCETDDEGSGGSSLWTESGAHIYREWGQA